MGFFDSVKCFTGFHDWTEWAYPAPNQCEQTRECKRNCGANQKQTVHEWPEFRYIAENSCEQNRNCSRCNLEEKKSAPHQLSEWEYLSEDRCDQERHCTRCEHPERRQLHAWDVWQHESPKSCKQIRFCRRCITGKEEMEPKDKDHSWTEPIRVNCTTNERVCIRCDKRKSQGGLNMHLFGPWHEPRQGHYERRCAECGKEESTTIRPTNFHHQNPNPQGFHRSRDDDFR